MPGARPRSADRTQRRSGPRSLRRVQWSDVRTADRGSPYRAERPVQRRHGDLPWRGDFDAECVSGIVQVDDEARLEEARAGAGAARLRPQVQIGSEEPSAAVIDLEIGLHQWVGNAVTMTTVRVSGSGSRMTIQGLFLHLVNARNLPGTVSSTTRVVRFSIYMMSEKVKPRSSMRFNTCQLTAISHCHQSGRRRMAAQWALNSERA